MTTEDTDQRRFHRLPFKASVVIKDPQSQQSWHSNLVDISLKGLLIDAPEGAPFKLNESYHVEVQLGDEETTIAIPDATIAHITAGHVGIACRLIDIDGISHLKRLLELNFGDPDLVFRELEQLAPR